MIRTSSIFTAGKLAAASVVAAFVMMSVASAQQTFKSADEAAETLAAALRAKDEKALTAILGPGSADVVLSGDAVDDENMRKAFLLAYDVKHSIKIDGDKPVFLVVGQDEYPFAIPLAKKGDSWSFDLVTGRKELLARRIGRNELAAIQVCLAYVDAQNEYSAVTKVGNLPVYAQRLVSTPGTKNGLYWPAAAGQAQSPIGAAVAVATLTGNRVGSGEPYHGYYYKILTRQGPKAPGGEHDYIVNGKMIGGFALVAWPATYGNSGIATFMVNHGGDVFEKDLGAATGKLAPQIDAFNPDESWKKVAVEK
jgi:hypothetical protein